MSADLAPEAYDVARVGLLDQLEVAREKLLQASLDAAMPGGDDAGMVAAEDEVRRIQQKLQGLSYGQKRAEAEQKQRDDAAKAVRRRESAVEILSLVNRRYWATQALDEALDAVDRAVEKIESLGHEISLDAAEWFGGDNRSETSFRLFLSNIDALDVTDTVFRVRRDIGETRRYSRGLVSGRNAALKALATAVPEALEKSVQDDATAKARADTSDG